MMPTFTTECSGHQISFQFQFGLVRDRVIVNDSTELNLSTLKSMAVQFITEKCPGHGITRVAERIMLFKHDYESSNVLQMVNAVTDIQEDTSVEICIRMQTLGDENVEIRPHALVIHSYKTPTFCHFCGEMLFGMFKQGLKCDGCGESFHKRCVFKIPNNCSYKKKRTSSCSLAAGSSSSLVSSSSIGAASVATADAGQFLIPPNNRDGSGRPSSPRTSRFSVAVGRPAWVDMQMATRLKIPHTFVTHTYTKPTKCHFCTKLLVGIFKQGVQCKDCRYNAHKKCEDKVPRDCSGEVLQDSLLEKQGDSEEFDQQSNGDDSDDDRGSHGGDETSGGPSATTGVIQSNFNLDTRPAQPNIPVQRLVQSVKQTKRVSKVLHEGWLVHFTNKGSMKRRHFWRLDTKAVTMFQNDTSMNYYKEIPLSEILAVETAKRCDASQHCFEIRTANVDYFVGEMSSGEDGAGVWEAKIRQALMPVQTTPSGISTGVGKTGENSSVVNTTDNNVSTTRYPSEQGGDVVSDKQRQEKDISQAYQIFPDEVLGSGQFGIVYGGVHRTTSQPVAIKVIDKLRFPTKQEAALKNEVAILQNLHHPGVVNLERMFETPERIFVVMEKLKGDMLEMILSSELGRLNERVTRFLVTQILIALKHLHSKNIVHCDLKPENVLLSSDSDFPQVKLCDFGFARIIGEKGFRKSVVGTPAYLAPEVLRNKGYNRSLDMWSTGVIVYVSLSGTFPFNEDEDINEQIQNASFMYPPHPWKEITSQAMDLIGNLLQVKSRKRYSVDKSLLHPWLDNFETWADLRDLENKVGTRWLTHESDDSRWEQHMKQHMEAKNCDKLCDNLMAS